ncbi:MAG: cytochrome c oxidase subunit II [Candidatus Pelagibacter sp.]|nr:cytochrome c oxidase subunit II [Candidatus Pelagibacter sp.]OUV87721.1 MAG: cytochrome c oxidase subunit II [Pelagibacteraceae bacterium TMED136]|tara:strand:+ start:18186 stop:19010 length:825 start_codon:yes stop_codon:yes gene_type:complete
MKKILFLFICTFALPAQASQPKDWQFGFQPPVTPLMKDVTWMHDYILLPVIIGISVFVLFLMLYTMVKFRESKNPTPSKTTHNVMVEVLWTVIPCIILVVIAVPSFKLLYKEETIPKADVTLKAIGHQWYWGYEYPDEKIAFESVMIEDRDLKPGQPRLLATDTKIVVPVNKIVKVLITSGDVNHAWAVPAFGVKRDAIKGRINETWFKAEKEGIYYGQCSELCGIKHAFMPIEVHVVSEDKYEAWLIKAKKEFAMEENNSSREAFKILKKEKM